MPWKRKKLKRTTKRSVAKKRTKKRTTVSKRKQYLSQPETRLRPKLTTSSVLSRPGIPDKTLVKLVYADQLRLQLDGTETVNYLEYTLSINNIFDPDSSGTGHQPRYLDQWMTLYQQWVVHAVHFDIQIFPATDTSTSTVAVNFVAGYNVGPPGAPTQFSDFHSILEQPKSKYYQYRFLNRSNSFSMLSSTPQIGGYGMNSSEMASGNFKLSFTMRDLFSTFGMGDYTNSSTAVWPEDFSGDVNAGPSQNWKLMLFAASLAQDGFILTSLPLPHLYAIINVQYDVEFYNPLIGAPSLGGSTGGIGFTGGTGQQAS